MLPATDRESERKTNLKICRVLRYTFEDKEIRRGSKDFFLIISIQILWDVIAPTWHRNARTEKKAKSKNKKIKEKEKRRKKL